MSDERLKRSTWVRLCVVLGAVLIVIAIALVLGPLGSDHGPGPPPTTTTTPTPAPQEYFEARDTASLTVPQTVRTAADTFEAAEGQSYLLRFEVSATKPEGSPGAAMYLGVSLNCAGEGEGDGNADSAGGTQNLITGEPTTLRNQFVLVGDGGRQSCNISVSAPRPEVAAAGTTLEVDVRWTAQPIDRHSFEVDSAERLPMSVPVDGRELVFSHTVDLDDVRGRRVNVLSTLHLTACTGVNGSRENGRAWCDAATIDTEGSEVDLVLRADLLDAEGQPCGQLDVRSDELHIDRVTHHQLMDLIQEVEVPHESCGSSLRLSMTVASQGPAPVVVHSSASSFVVVVGELKPGRVGEAE